MKILEIIIGIILIYSILSILVSILAEWRNSITSARGKLLKESINQMLDDPLNLNYGYLLLNHPLVSSMRNKLENRPFQYLDAGIFADALIDVIASQEFKGIPLNEKESPPTCLDEDNEIIQKFICGLEAMNNSPFKKMLQSLLMKSNKKYSKLKGHIEDWYDSNMERTTGWYKRKQRTKLFVLGLCVAFALNADSIHLLKVISMDDELRSNLVEVAEGVVEDYEVLTPEQKQDIDQQINILKTNIKDIDPATVDSSQIVEWKNDLNALANKINLSNANNEKYLEQANEILDISSGLGLPIGWNCDDAPLTWKSIPFCWMCPNNESVDQPLLKNGYGKYLYNRNHDPNFWTFFFWLLGIVLTGTALSFGAPFWFDLLVKFVNIRQAGIKPLVKQEK